MNKRLQSKRKGSVIVLVMFVVIVLLIVGAGLLSLGLCGRIFAIRTTSDIVARCAADAGLTKAVFEMNEKLKVKPWDDSTLPQTADETLPNCDAIFSYTVTGDVAGGYTVESTGNYGHSEKKVSSILPLQGLFEYAIFASQDIDLKNGTSITMYNSGTDGLPLQIGTNSTQAGAITSRFGVTINGDVVVGLRGDPDVVITSHGATITGDTYAMTERYELPLIIVPGYLQSSPSQGTITNTTTITTSGKYDSIALYGVGKVITIDRPVELYVIGDVILGNSAELRILDANDASLTLYLGGNLETKNGGTINNLTQDPQKLKLYGLSGCQNLDLKNSGVFYGAIYTPNADIVLHNSVEVYGSVIANSFEQKATADFHYDASLRDVSINDEGVRFVVKQWQEE